MKAGAGIALTALCAAVAALPAAIPINADVAWYIQATRQWAEGQQLYVEIGDVNLPSVFLLHRLAYEIATLFGGLGKGQGDYYALLGLFGLQLFGVTLLVRRLLRDVPELDEGTKAALIFAFPLVAALAGIGNFAERDHWMLAAILPHALCLYRSQLGVPVPRKLAIASALLAAFFALLKPYFLLPYLLLEAYAALRHRSLSLPFRAENFIAAGFYIASFGALYLMFPLYFTETVPQAQKAYAAYSYEWFVGFGRSDVFIPCGLAACLFLASGRLVPRPVAELVRILFALTLAFAASYLAQQKGWYYQFVPALAFSVLGSVTLLTALLSERLLPRQHRGVRSLLGTHTPEIAAAGLALLLPLQLAYLTALELRADWNYGDDMIALVEVLREDPEAGYLSLSPALYPAFPAATLSHAHWTYDQPQLWKLPVHYQPRFNGGETVPFRPPAEQTPAEQAAFRSVVEPFLAERPRVVTVVKAQNPPIMQRDFDFLGYFLQDPNFAAAWRDYALWGEIENHFVYLRQPDD